MIRLGAPACSPSLRRIELMWTSSVLVDPHQFSSHTSSIRRSRVTAAPADSASTLITSNSFGRSAISVPSSVTRRAATSTDRSSSSIADLTARALRVRLAHAEVGGDPGQQFGETERLDDVVDGARLEAEHDVDLRIAGGEHDDRHGRVLAGGVHGDHRPVAVGQTEVEQHEVGRIGVERLDRGRDGADRRGVVPVGLERAHEAGRDQRVVLDHQHAARHALHATNIWDTGARCSMS